MNVSFVKRPADRNSIIPAMFRPQYRSGAVERLPGVSTLLFCVTSYCQSTAGLRAAAGLSNHK